MKVGKLKNIIEYIVDMGKCCICGNKGRSHWKDGKLYCQKHYMQLYHHGRILERTIYDKNRWFFNDDYCECATYDKNSKENGRIIFDLDDYEKLKEYKLYIRNHNGKLYGIISIGSKKYFVHRFILGLHVEKFSIDKEIDHINGNSLDNRKSNLRICSRAENMKNIRKTNKIIGISYSKRDNKFISRIMSNYKTINLGKFDTFEEALFARIKKEKELCGEFGSNRDLYFILDKINPIEELKKLNLNNE